MSFLQVLFSFAAVAQELEVTGRLVPYCLLIVSFTPTKDSECLRLFYLGLCSGCIRIGIGEL